MKRIEGDRLQGHFCAQARSNRRTQRGTHMTNEERDIITQFITRVGGSQRASGFAGSVPATTQPALPPVEPEADRLIHELFQRNPEAAYRITQLAFVQEQALTEAQSRIQRLEWDVQQARQAAQQAEQQRGSSGGGFFSGLFGGGRTAPSAPPPQQGGPGPAWNQGGPPPGYQPNYQQSAPQYAPPPPQYAPGYQPGMFQRSGSGFLGSALTTAAGVAGGMVAGNALMGLFSGHHGYGGFGGGMGAGGFASPWAGPAASPTQEYVDQGSWDTPAAGAPASQDYVDNGTWDQPIDPAGGGGLDNTADAGWDNAGGGDAGWDQGSSGGADDDSLI